MKGKIIEMMAVYKKNTGTLVKIPDWPMLGFQDFEKVGGIPEEIFPLVIIATVRQFNVSQFLIDGGNFYDIMHSDLF